MKLLDDINLADFFRKVQTCRGEVLLVTSEGDRLNLKSALSQFVFAAAIRGNLQFSGASILLEYPGDKDTLTDYIRED